MNEQFLKDIYIVHFVGIGGIGVSAVARMMLGRGIRVSGSDREPSPVTDKLETEGVTIFIGHDVTNVPDGCDLVIHSPAVPAENPELQAAHDRGIKSISYPEALGMMSQGMRTIAISGTHGKTTTTAMIAEILVGANLSPTVIVGSLLKKTGSNFIAGNSNIFVVEACEYKRSFLNLTPEILVITNVDNDHLDYFGTIKGVQAAFTELAEKVLASGFIVCDPSSPLIEPVLINVSARIVDYTKETITTPLTVHGDHNSENAKAALAVARILGVESKEAEKLVGQFSGTWRRMEHKGRTESGAEVYDDYAHHPTEIKATLQGFRSKYPSVRIRVVFQPHLYSRTKLLLNEFAESFSNADEVIIAPIYAAREENDIEIGADILATEISKHHKNAHVVGGFPDIEKYLRGTTEAGDVMITMGAGNIYKVGEDLLK